MKQHVETQKPRDEVEERRRRLPLFDQIRLPIEEQRLRVLVDLFNETPPYIEVDWDE